MNINEKNIKLWSSIGSRATFGLAVLELGKSIDNLMVLTSDVSTSAGLDRFKKAYPEKYLDVGIAEQNLIGIAAGLASENYNVITTTFAPFQVMRCCEQIKVNLGYMKNKVCMVGIASGLVLGNLGYTHCCIEDVGVLRSIPNLKIISPADTLETVKALEAVVKNKDSSVYIRLTGSSNNPAVYDHDYKFEIGKAIELVSGEHIVIFCCGTMVHHSLEVSKILRKNNINAKVVNMHTIKPIDKEAIKNAIEAKLIVSIEEHNVIGGLGSAVAEELSKLGYKNKHLTLGIQDEYSEGGDYKYLLDRHGLSIEKIINKILTTMEKL
jgi:transketolase